MTRAVLACLVLFAASASADELERPDGVKLHYTVEGKGEPLLLVHGLAASADLNWRVPGLIERLSREHRVIALDQRGHGRSSAPDRDGAYGEALVADVVALLDALKVERTDVAGYSLGGMVALNLAARHPERVKRVVLCGMGWLEEGTLVQRSFRLLPRLGRVPGPCVREVGELALTAEQVAAVKAPVQVIVGELDPIRRLYVEPLKRARPEWPVALIPRTGHLTCVLSPEFADRLAAALKPE